MSDNTTLYTKWHLSTGVSLGAISSNFQHPQRLSLSLSTYTSTTAIAARLRSSSSFLDPRFWLTPPPPPLFSAQPHHYASRRSRKRRWAVPSPKSQLMLPPSLQHHPPMPILSPLTSPLNSANFHPFRIPRLDSATTSRLHPASPSRWPKRWC